MLNKRTLLPASLRKAEIPSRIVALDREKQELSQKRYSQLKDLRSAYGITTAKTRQYLKTKMFPMIHTPIPESYWVIPHELLAGEYPRTLDELASKKKIEAFIAAGVKAFIDLTKESEGLEPYSHLLQPYENSGVMYQRFAIRDQSVPSHPQLTTEVLDAIDNHLNHKRMVYVHCWGGVGRTGTIVGCWLSRHGHEGEQALGKLKELWKQCSKSPIQRSPETREQERYIREWKEIR